MAKAVRTCNRFWRFIEGCTII